MYDFLGSSFPVATISAALIPLLHFAKYLIKIAVKVAHKNRKSCNIKFLETAQNIELHRF